MFQSSGGGPAVHPQTTANGGAALGGVDQGGNTYRNAPGDWSQFFGPSKGPIETAPYGSYRRENFALPDAYQGSNAFLTNVIITLVTEQVSRPPPDSLVPHAAPIPWAVAPTHTPQHTRNAATPPTESRTQSSVEPATPVPHPLRAQSPPAAFLRVTGPLPLRRTCGPSRWRCRGG